MTATGDPGSQNLWGDQDAQIRRVRQFTNGRLAASVAGFVALGVIWLINGSRWVGVTALAVIVPFTVLLFAHRYLQQGEINRAIVMTAVSNWAIVILLSFMLAPVFIGFAPTTLWPVLQAIPFVDRATLRRLIVVTIPVTMLCVGLALLGDPIGFEDTIGSGALTVGTFIVGAVMYPLTFALIWQYYGRLEEAVTDLHESNVALLESERDLERKVEERTAQLAETSAYISSVIANLEQGLIALELDGSVGRTNAALVDMFGADAQEQVPAEIASLLASRPSDDGVTSGLVELSRGRVGKAVATPLRVADEAGVVTVAGTIVLIDDVTAEREIDRVKTDFISTVSHELRTPLTSIIGFAKIIEKRMADRLVPRLDRTDPKVDKAVSQIEHNLGIIDREGQRLTSLINDMLDIAKMEAGGFEWKLVAGDLGEVASAAIDASSALFAEGEVELISTITPGSTDVAMDRERMIQVVINLISNARKFTDAGQVEVAVHRDGSDALVVVRDSGIGIPSAEIPRLFDRFHQVGSLADRPAGTGLGLPICREIVAAHNGDIAVDSELGEGTVVTVRLPIATVAA